MKIISFDNQTIHSAGLSFVQFENENEGTVVKELIRELSIPDAILPSLYLADTILMDDGFFCKTTDLDEILVQLNEYLNEEEGDDDDWA